MLRGGGQWVVGGKGWVLLPFCDSLRPNVERGFILENSHPADKPLGIIIMVLNAVCGVGLGLLAMVGGAALGAMGGAAAAGSGASAGEAAAGAGAAAAAGGLVAILGVVSIILGIAGIAMGFGIMKSLRWGFTVGMIVSALNFIVNIFQLPQGIIGMAISGAIAYFCWGRLNGKIGPAPM